MALDDDRIRATVRKVLEGADLDVITSRSVRQSVGNQLGIVNIDDYKDLVEAEVKAFLEEQSADPLPAFTPVGGQKRKGSPGEPNGARATRARTTAAQSASSEFELALNRRVVVRQFNGRQLIDIREFYEKEGEQLPGKKGLALSQPQWAALRAGLPDACAAVEAENEAFLLELGGSRRLTVGRYKQKLNVNLREYYEKDGELLPGKKGIALALPEWEALVSQADAIDAAAGSPTEPQPSAGPAATAAQPAAAQPPAQAGGSGTANNGEDFLDLGGNRRASLSDWKGSLRLNLREYYSKDGQMLPGKKGISLPKEQAAKLAGAAEALGAALAEKREMELQLGPLRHAKVRAYKGKYSVDVREYYEKEGEERPGQKGLSFSGEQWALLAPRLQEFVDRM